jgi:hypothetical protein
MRGLGARRAEVLGIYTDHRPGGRRAKAAGAMAAPLRTLSARILLGFAALIVTFGITTVLIVTYMDDVGVEIGVIRTGYLKLALTTKDLSRKQDDLRSYLSDDLLGEASARRVEVRLRALRLARDRLLAEAQATLAEVSSVPSRHGKRLERTREDVTRLAQAVGAQEARYARLLAAPPARQRAGRRAPPRRRRRARRAQGRGAGDQRHRQQPGRVPGALGHVDGQEPRVQRGPAARVHDRARHDRRARGAADHGVGHADPAAAGPAARGRATDRLRRARGPHRGARPGRGR